VERAVIGGTLTPEELLDVSSTLSAAMRLRKFIKELDSDFEILREYAERIVPQPDIVREVERCIDEYGNVVDHASSELARVRSQIRTANNRIREKLDSIIKSQECPSPPPGVHYYPAFREICGSCKAGVASVCARDSP